MVQRRTVQCCSTLIRYTVVYPRCPTQNNKQPNKPTWRGAVIITSSVLWCSSIQTSPEHFAWIRKVDIFRSSASNVESPVEILRWRSRGADDWVSNPEYHPSRCADSKELPKTSGRFLVLNNWAIHFGALHWYLAIAMQVKVHFSFLDRQQSLWSSLLPKDSGGASKFREMSMFVSWWHKRWLRAWTTSRVGFSQPDGLPYGLSGFPRRKSESEISGEPQKSTDPLILTMKMP